MNTILSGRGIITAQKKKVDSHRRNHDEIGSKKVRNLGAEKLGSFGLTRKKEKQSELILLAR